MRFLYTFGFCNQAISLTPSLKILLVFLYEVVANQLHQSKVVVELVTYWDSCKEVSHVLGSVHH